MRTEGEIKQAMKIMITMVQAVNGPNSIDGAAMTTAAMMLGWVIDDDQYAGHGERLLKELTKYLKHKVTE